MFLDNVFNVHTKHEAEALNAYLRNQITVVHNKILVNGVAIYGNQNNLLKSSVLRAGAPLYYILNHVHNTTNLPNGAL